MAGVHRKRKRKSTTTDDYADMLVRMINAYGRRTREDPATGLPHLHRIEAALTSARDAAIWGANVDGHSINEMAGILGQSKQAIHKRVQAGEVTARNANRGRTMRSDVRQARPRELTDGG